MDFLSANWIWLLLGLAVVWMLVSRGGCGFGGSHSHRPNDTNASARGDETRHDHRSANGNAAPRPRDAERAAPSRRRGC